MTTIPCGYSIKIQYIADLIVQSAQFADSKSIAISGPQHDTMYVGAYHETIAVTHVVLNIMIPNKQSSKH